MTMVITFEKHEKELILCYAPTMGIEDILKRLFEEKACLMF